MKKRKTCSIKLASIRSLITEDEELAIDLSPSWRASEDLVLWGMCPPRAFVLPYGFQTRRGDVGVLVEGSAGTTEGGHLFAHFSQEIRLFG